MKKTVRNFQLIFLMLFLSSGAALSQLTGDTYAKAKETGTANWTLTYAEAPGFASSNRGTMTGITVDLMKDFKAYVEKTEGIKVNINYKSKDPDDFTLFLEEVKKARGGVFGLSNTTITSARQEMYSFSPSYITNIGMIISNEAAPTLKSLSEIATKFSGMTAVTVKNSTNEKKILDIQSKYFPALKIKYVSSFRKAMNAVIKDSNAFTNIDFTYYLEAMKARKPIKRHPAGDDTAEQFGIIMPTNNDWEPLLKKFMSSEYLRSMEYKKIIASNLGQSAMKFLLD